MVTETNEEEIITGIRLIKNSENLKDHTFDDEVEEIPHHTFFVTSDEFGDSKDNFV